MKNDKFSKSIERVISVKLRAVDRFLEKVTEPLSEVGNPEELIGKGYSEWSPDDLERLKLIYGEKDDSPLARLIFRREYQRVLDLEKEEK